MSFNFPDRPMRKVVRVAFGADLTADPSTWVYTDLSDRVMDELISIKRGGLDEEGGQPGPSECSLTLDNDDGELTPHRPNSTLYPYVRQGAPIDVGFERVVDDFDRTETDAWGDSETGDTWVLDGTASDFDVTPGAATIRLPVTGDIRTASLDTVNIGDFEAYLEWTIPVKFTGTFPTLSTYIIARMTGGVADSYLFRVQADDTNVRARIIQVVGGVSTDLTSEVVAEATWAGGDTFAIRAQAVGTTLRMKAWNVAGTEPTTWDLEVIDDAHASGAVAVRQQIFGTFTGPSTLPLTVSHGTFRVLVIRFAGEVEEWAPEWQQGASDTALCRVKAFGILSRLGQGGDTERSAMRRTIDALTPAAYWPLEDAEGATEGAPGLTGGTPLAVAGTVAFGAETDHVGSLRTPDMKGGRLYAPVSGVSVSGDGWVLEFVTRFDVATGTARRFVSLVLDSVSDFKFIDMDLPSLPGTNTHSVRVRDAQDPQHVIITVGHEVDDIATWNHVAIHVYNVGADGHLDLYINGVLVSSDSEAGQQAGSPIDITINKSMMNEASFLVSGEEYLSIAHVMFHNVDGTVPLSSGGWNAYDGELAAERFDRLCLEEKLACTIWGSVSEAMGPQPVGAIVPLLEECATADAAVMLDGGPGHGLEFYGNDARQNLATHLELDAAVVGELIDLEAINDSQHVRNWVEVMRPGGTTQTATESSPSHPMSTVNVGKRDEQFEVNVETDPQALFHAGLRLVAGTVDRTRYPNISLELGGAPDLIDVWLRTRVTYRMSLAGLDPDQHPPGAVERVITGWQEWLGHDVWPVVINTGFVEPWQAFRLASTSGDTDPNVGYLTPDGGEAVTIEALDTTETSVDIDSEPHWESAADNWTPAVPILIGGEGMTVSAVTPRLLDAFGRTVANGWGAADTGQSYTTDGGVAGNYSVASGVGTHTLSTTVTPRLCYIATSDIDAGNTDIACTILIPQVATGAGIRAGLIARFVDTSNYYFLDVEVTTALGVILRIVERFAGSDTTIASYTSALRHTTTLTMGLRFRLRDGFYMGRVWNAAGAEPSGWQVSEGEGTLPSGSVGVRSHLVSGNTNVSPVVNFDALTLRNPATLTVTRSTNGVTKAHDSGTPVELASPGITILSA